LDRERLRRIGHVRHVRAVLALTIATASAPAYAQTPPIPPPPAAPAAPVAPTAASAAAESSAGDKAAKAKDWAGALGRYQTVQQVAPTAHAQLGVADALYQLARAGEAFDAYTEAQRTYSAKLSGADKTLVATRLKELASKTGALSIHVEEPGSDVALDGKSIGTSPIAALVRVAAGTHEVRVTRAGFAPFVGAADVQADGKSVVDANPLVAQSTRGHVVVHAPGTESLRVVVDGVDLGATPWEGDLPSGQHEVTGRSSSVTSIAQTINVTAGASLAIDLVTSATAAHLEVRTNDGKGVVYVDGVAKGDGAFVGDVAPGSHTVVVEREGYERFEKTVSLGERETWAETVSLKGVQAAASTGAATRAFEGLYGGFGLTGLFGVGGEGTDLDTSCGNLGASGCDSGQAAGGGLFGYVGWTFDPVGFELMVAGEADTASETAHFTSTGANSTSPLAFPPRDETFTFARLGGLTALRVRATLDGRIVRATVAGGVGLSYKKLLMKRDSLTTDGTNRVDVYSPTADTSVAYLSPALTLEGSVQVRVTPTVAFTAGLLMWADNASIWGSNSTPPPAAPRFLGAASQAPVAIATPAYHLATGAQVFLGPFLGMAFGP
jgi:hypothetical protein